MPHRRVRMHRLSVVTAAAGIAFALTACQPEPEVTTPAGPTPEASGQVDAATEAATPTPTPTSAFVLPAACEEIYSADMLAALLAENPPLNDPDVTMYSSENAAILELIDSGAPTIRCTWGGPSEYGLATNVTLADAAQAATVRSELTAAGFSDEELGGGSVHRIEQRGITLDDEPYTLGETHYIGSGAIVSTRWINFAPSGYTEDIVSTLW